MLITLYYDDQPPGRTRSRTEPESRPCLIGATAGGYALKMLQRVFRYCANEYKMDVNGKFGLLFFPFQWCIHVQFKNRGM